MIPAAATPARGAIGDGFRTRHQVLLGIVLTAAIMPLGRAGGETQLVFQTCVWAILLLPVVITAWMLGIALTGPFAAAGCFEGSPSPSSYRTIVAIALGLGAFSLGTLLLGTLHLLTIGGKPWPILLLPVAAAAIGFMPTRNLLQQPGNSRPTARPGDWLMLIAAVPVAMMIIAATFPPGSLWISEAHGYDVLEYHLELPREFADLNSTAPLAHNVYSYFPANIEMLYLMLTQLAKIAMSGRQPSVGGVSRCSFCMRVSCCSPPRRLR